MTVETFSYISQLNANYPAADDFKYEGDDHLRGVKYTLQTTFPNINAAINFTPTEANLLVGWTVRGSAASVDVGTAAGEIPQLSDVGGVAALPQVDGSQLLNIATTDVVIADTEISSLLHARVKFFYYGLL